MDEREREVTLSIIPPTIEEMRTMQGNEYLMLWRIQFNDSTYSMRDFLSACLPYLDQIGETADNVRAMRQIEGHDFAEVTLGD